MTVVFKYSRAMRGECDDGCGLNDHATKLLARHVNGSMMSWSFV